MYNCQGTDTLWNFLKFLNSMILWVNIEIWMRLQSRRISAQNKDENNNNHVVNSGFRTVWILWFLLNSLSFLHLSPSVLPLENSGVNWVFIVDKSIIIAIFDLDLDLIFNRNFWNANQSDECPSSSPNYWIWLQENQINWYWMVSIDFISEKLRFSKNKH